MEYLILPFTVTTRRNIIQTLYLLTKADAGTAKAIQHELLQCTLEFYPEHIVILLCYELNGNILERFWVFAESSCGRPV